MTIFKKIKNYLYKIYNKCIDWYYLKIWSKFK